MEFPVDTPAAAGKVQAGQPAAGAVPAPEQYAAPVKDTDRYAPNSGAIKSGKLGDPVTLPSLDIGKAWPHPVGQAFKVDGPLRYDGQGRTVTCTPTRLVLDWDQKVPDSRDPGPENPVDGQMHIRFDLQITDPARGLATFKVINRDDKGPNAELQHDTRATWKLHPKSGRIYVEYVGKTGKHSFEFGLNGTVELDGHDHDTSVIR